MFSQREKGTTVSTIIPVGDNDHCLFPNHLFLRRSGAHIYSHPIIQVCHSEPFPTLHHSTLIPSNTTPFLASKLRELN